MKRTRFCRQHLLFWGLSLLTPFISQGQVCSAGKQSYETLLKVSKETLKQSHIGYATSNMADYCQRNFLLRFINSRKKATPDCEAKSTEELEKLALALTVEISDDLLENHPWNFGLIPTEKTAIHALDLSIEHLGYSKENTLPPLERLRKNLEGGTHLRPDKEKQLKNRIDELKATQDLEINRKVYSLKSLALCAEMSILNSFKCQSGLEIIADKMIPKSSGGKTKFSDIELWEDVLLNKKYDEGLRRAGLKILSRVDGKLSSGDNVYDDVIGSFKESGMNQNEAHKATLKIMGVISNGAQNTASRLSAIGYEEPDLDNKSNALTVLASSLQLLDFRKSKAGQPLYSMPPNVNSKCLNMKPYHFWMAAYLSESLVTDYNLQPDAAAIATYSSQKAYQITREIGRPGDGVGAVSSILNSQPFGPVHQVIRMDLAFSAAGAQWGATSNLTSQKTFDVDSALLAMMKDSTVKPPALPIETQNQSTEKKYLAWRLIFAPNTAFESLSK